MEFAVNCTHCRALAGDRCTAHDVELDNPAFAVCAQFQSLGEDPAEAGLTELTELSPDWIYELDAAGEPTPWVQVARKRKRPLRTTGQLAASAELPETTPLESAGRLDRFEGALVGLALGDALGFPAEGRSPGEIEMIYGGPLTTLVGRIGRRHAWPVGQVTKDTQLARCLAESLVKEGELDMDDFAERLVRWLPSGLRAGQSTTRAVQALTDGRHWCVSGIASNGASGTVRVVPLALMYSDLAALRQAAVLQCLVTHQGPKALAGAVLFATAIASLAATERGKLHKTDWLALLERAVRGIDVEVSSLLQQLTACLADRLEADEATRRFKTGGYVLECLPSALYCFLAHPDEPRRAMLAAANAGFDASTVAAMTGALAGAYQGLSGLPGGLVRQLPCAPELVVLAGRLHAAGGA